MFVARSRKKMLKRTQMDEGIGTDSYISDNMDANNSVLQDQGTVESSNIQESMHNVEKVVNEEMKLVDEKHKNANEVSKPYIGMTFDTEDDAYDYYSYYAKVVGFSVRKSYTSRSRKTGEVMSRMLVCSKQGYTISKDDGESGKKVKRRRDVREDCDAHLQVFVRDDGKWEVRKFYEKHTHPVITPLKIPRSTARTEAMTALHNFGIGPPKLDEAIDLSSESLFATQKCMDHLKTTHKGNVGKEWMNVINYFQKKVIDDEGFFLKWELEEDIVPRSIFWADARSRDSYITFGDVVIFSTYKFNKFGMSFVSFSGVNHHRQLIPFGCGLLIDETEEKFIWLFQTWLECMHGKYPTIIITDQDVAMSHAIRKIFPETRHTFRMWHIQMNALSNIQDLCVQDNFEEDYNKWVRDSVSIEEFEEKWPILKKRYNIPDGHWIENMYNKRHHWVQIYLNDVFFAGMPSIQRNKSMNSIFDDFLNANLSLSEVVYQYDQAIYACREAEEQEDFRNLNSEAILFSRNPLENHARKVYTNKVFYIFQEEFKNIVDYHSTSISEDAHKSVYSVYLAGTEDEERNIVVHDDYPSISIKCSCKKFELDGIFCAHILHILNFKSILSLPEHYILHRWTMNARYSKALIVHDTTSTCIDGERCITPKQKWTYKTNMWKAVEMGLRSPYHLDVAVPIVEDLIQKLSITKDANAIQSFSDDVSVASTVNSQGLDAVVYDLACVSKRRPKKIVKDKSSVEVSLLQPELNKLTCKNCGKKGHYMSMCTLSRGWQADEAR